MGCNLLTDQASGVKDPPHNLAKGLACSFVANQTVKVPQVLCKWGLSRDSLSHNETPPENGLPRFYYTISLSEACMTECQFVKLDKMVVLWYYMQRDAYGYRYITDDGLLYD